MKVKDLLKVVEADCEINVILYAYGQYYASTFADGMIYVKEVLANASYDCLNAKVILVLPGEDFIKVKASII